MKRLFLFVAPLLLTGCAYLPHSGPSTSRFINNKNFKVVTVTPAMAIAMDEEAKADYKRAELLQESRLLALAPKNADQLQPGDRFHLTIFSHELHIFNEGGSAIKKTDMGDFQVDRRGSVYFPFIGNYSVHGKTIKSLTQDLDIEYEKRHIFLLPSVKIRWSVKNGNTKGVLVSGDVQHSILIPWQPGGLTLARALTMAGVQSRTASSRSRGTSSHPSYMVHVYDQKNDISIPLNTAFSHTWNLPSGSRVLVIEQAPVQITIIGGGVLHSGVFSYAGTETLETVLAAAGGLNPQTANDRAIFVLSSGKKPTIYRIRWNTVQGFVAAKNFPITNGNIVYVPISPVVPIQKAVQIFSGFLLPPALLANSVK